MVVKIDILKCTGCGACTYVCPVGVLSIEDMKCRVSEGCISCGACVDACAFQAITLEDQQNKVRGSKRGETPFTPKPFPVRRRRRGHMGRGRR